MSSFDSNNWYQLTLPYLFTNQSLVGNVPASGNTAGVNFFLTNTSSPRQRWQIFETENDTYILRSNHSSPNGYLAIKDDDNGSTAIIRHVQRAANEVFWNIIAFQNGGYSLVNVANGTDWHLQHGEKGRMHMTKNTTGEEHANQRFIFKVQGQINDPAFSSIVLPSGATATAPGFTPASSSNNSGSGSTDSRGLSTGIKVAIGVCVGVALIALIAGIFFLRRRRKNRTPVQDPPQIYNAELDARQSSYNAEPTPVKYAYQELSAGNRIQELEAEQTQTNANPVELPVTQPAIQR